MKEKDLNGVWVGSVGWGRPKRHKILRRKGGEEQPRRWREIVKCFACSRVYLQKKEDDKKKGSKYAPKFAKIFPSPYEKKVCSTNLFSHIRK